MKIEYKYRIIIVFSLILSVFSLSSCSLKTTSPLQATELDKQMKEESKHATTGSWESEWEKTLSAAKKEGKVVVYTTLTSQMFRDVSSMFKDKYGLTIEITGGRGTEFRAKLQTEQRNGIFFTDVAMSGLNTIFSIKGDGYTDPLQSVLILPEVTDPKGWFGGELPFADKDQRIIKTMAYPSSSLLINHELVKPEDVKSFYDLLNPKFKGKIVMSDPTVTGSAFNLFSTMLYHKVLDQDFFRQLVKQELVLTRDLRLEVEWIARGKFAIDWGAQNTPIQEFKDLGAPLTSIVVKEGTYLSSSAGNIILVKNAPHPNAAKVLINWILTREGQILQQKYMGSHSRRENIPLEGVEPVQIRKPGAKYYVGANEIEEWVKNEQDEYMKLARDIFGPLSK